MFVMSSWFILVIFPFLTVALVCILLGRRIRAEQKRTMKQLHPNCRFVTVDNPTEGGWRKHSHYNELHEFFRTGVYVPFSE